MTLAEQTWVLTGAAGRIGSSLRPGLAARVVRLRLTDHVPVEPASPNEEAVVADLRDQDAIERAIAGAHGVLHVGGLADEADFHDIAEMNIVGTYHVLEAARRAGARRVVYASSNRATGFYPTTTLVDPVMPPRPDGVYGAGKVAAEALGFEPRDDAEDYAAGIPIGDPPPPGQPQGGPYATPGYTLDRQG